MSFVSCKIELDGGNDAMNTSDDIAEALRDVADKIERGDDSFRIVDANGNTVGDVSIWR